MLQTRALLFTVSTLFVGLFCGDMSHGQEIYRVGTYREYTGSYGSGGGYSGPSADHWMFHQRQDSRGSSRGAASSGAEIKKPVEPNMVLLPVNGIHLYTDKTSYVEFHEHSRRSPREKYQVQNKDMCRLDRTSTVRGETLIHSFSCFGVLANLNCSLSGDIVSCGVSQANGEHTGNPGQQTVRLQLMSGGDYNAWVKTRVIAY